jgi:dolichol kinase
MLKLDACLLGLLVLLIIAEYIGKKKILKGEYHRKFLHITAGTFIAFWPWLISWRWIQVLSLALLFGMLANRYFGFLNYHGKVGRATYGDILYALAIFICSLLTHNRYFFALAVAEVAIADGFAAIVGSRYIKYWGYGVFRHKKTVIGSMVFWIATVCIFGYGLLSAHDFISYQNYFLILLLFPPLLTLLENLSIYGFDNIVIPIAVVVLLRALQI